LFNFFRFYIFRLSRAFELSSLLRRVDNGHELGSLHFLPFKKFEGWESDSLEVMDGLGIVVLFQTQGGNMLSKQD